MIPTDHVSRKPSDTYYVDDTHVLRTHTSAHQVDLLRAGNERFLAIGDVYRRDAIDSTHFPVFHQIEAVCLEPKLEGIGLTILAHDGWVSPEDHLRKTINHVLNQLFPNSPVTWKPDHFPFTKPSFEVEVDLDGKPLEVLGCGVIHPDVLAKAGLVGYTGKVERAGWAFGMGLERLAMRLFKIPDIRLFWCEDPRFLDQFADGKVRDFVPFSKYPLCYKDLAFWAPDTFHEHDLLEVVREVGGSLVESVIKIDTFKKAGRTSHCFRVNYRSLERSLTNDEVDTVQNKVREVVRGWEGYEVR